MATRILILGANGQLARNTTRVLPFQRHDISLYSLSALIVRIATTPGLLVRSSIGMSDK